MIDFNYTHYTFHLVRFFKRELEREQDPFRRQLLLTEILNCEQRIVRLMREDRERMETENRNMLMALEIIKKRDEERKKREDHDNK